MIPNFTTATPEQVAEFVAKIDSLWRPRFKLDRETIIFWVQTLGDYHAQDLGKALAVYQRERTSEQLEWPPNLAQLLSILAVLHRKRMHAISYNWARMEHFMEEGDDDAAARSRQALESWL